MDRGELRNTRKAQKWECRLSLRRKVTKSFFSVIQTPAQLQGEGAQTDVRAEFPRF